MHAKRFSSPTHAYNPKIVNRQDIKVLTGTEKNCMKVCQRYLFFSNWGIISAKLLGQASGNILVKGELTSGGATGSSYVLG